jgi:hypothetical protein
LALLDPLSGTCCRGGDYCGGDFREGFQLILLWLFSVVVVVKVSPKKSVEKAMNILVG